MIFTITTPLYYVNDRPHLGSIYTTIICDAIARYFRLKNKKVNFITGVDEHGLKIQRTAKEKGLDPQSHCDIYADIFKNSWEQWNITNDQFVRTTSDKHIDIVNKFFKKVEDSGDIKLDIQKGWYCVGCEEFKDIEDDNSEKICSVHKKKLEWKNEENLFFRLSNYQEYITELVNKKDFIRPESRKNEIIQFVNSGLRDFSISRINLDWGIPVPGYKGHTFYVWFDALLGYINGYIKDNPTINLKDIESENSPLFIHFIGKDILRFHAIYWPAMLASANMKAPKMIFGHGFLTREGQKMGKTLGNVLDPQSLLTKYGIDPVRWYLLRNIQLGSDGDFQDKRFVDLINNDLANTIGNLLNRTISMSSKWFNNSSPNPLAIKDSEKYPLESKAQNLTNNYIDYLENYELHKAAELIVLFASDVNTYLNDMTPWTLIKSIENTNQVAKVIYDVLESCRIIGLLLNPFVPELSIKILNQLNSKDDLEQWDSKIKFGLLKRKMKLPSPSPVISKLEYQDGK
tara:strand:+ start:824 stop:2371 length:1548 start_codon:yes stop_codon:yes gene_type:complete